jgi:hypothetical protein
MNFKNFQLTFFYQQYYKPVNLLLHKQLKNQKFLNA